MVKTTLETSTAHGPTRRVRIGKPLEGSGVTWAYLRDENSEGRDLNRDADTADLVLGLWRR